VVGIEEPEVAVHPAVAGVLMDAMRECSNFTQVIATTHSPDLIDSSDLDVESLLIVDALEGNTILGQADGGSVKVMTERLYTAGELLRQGQLQPRNSIERDEGLSSVAAQEHPLFKDI
jgi:predicted ATPase